MGEGGRGVSIRAMQCEEDLRVLAGAHHGEGAWSIESRHTPEAGKGKKTNAP